MSDLGRRRWPWIGLLIALGAAYRFVYVFDQVGSLDGDNAVVALMARHIMQGRHYAFFWGQAYMGTLEPYSIAAVASLFGLNDVVLRAVPLAWSIGYVATFYPLTRLVYGPAEGLVALGLAAVAPPLLAVWGPSPRGGYSTMLFLGHLTLIVAILLSREAQARRRMMLAFALGIVGGLAFWTHLLSVTYLGAAAIALFVRDRAIVLGRLPWIAAVGFVAGSAPLWIANLASGFATWRFMTESGHGRKIAAAGHDLLVIHGPKLLGLRDLVGEPMILLPPLGHVLAVALVVAIVWAAVRALFVWLGSLRRGERAVGPELFVLLLTFVLGLDLTSRFGLLNTERYLLPAYGAIFPLVADAVVRFTAGRPLRAVLLATSYAAVMIRGAIDLHSVLSAPTSFSVDLPEVVAFMERKGVRYGLADHSEALVNTYRSGERVILRDYSIGRYPIGEVPDWRIEAFLVRGNGEAMRAALEAMHIPAQVERFRHHALVYEPHLENAIGIPLPKRGWHVRATGNTATAELAIDDDTTTRWSSASPQAPGLAFEIDLGGAIEVTGVRLDAGAFLTDPPRALRVEGRRGDAWETIVEIPRPLPGLFVEAGELRKIHAPIVEARFEPRRLRGLRLVQTGRDNRYDWSIAEVDVFAVTPGEDRAPQSTSRPVSPGA